jgi:hypothetical protein
MELRDLETQKGDLMRYVNPIIVGVLYLKSSTLKNFCNC